MKVYELARELKLKSVELVDALRKECDIPVKNHMQALTDPEVAKVREVFKMKVEKQKATTGVKKTAVRRKKVAASKSSTTASSTPILSPKRSIIRRTAKASSAVKKIVEQEQDVIKSELEHQTIQAQTAQDLANPLAERLIRPGMVVGKTANVFKDVDAIIDTELSKLDKKKPKKLTIEKEGQNKQFRATDFRKREIIFQPKKKRINVGASSRKTVLTQAKAHKRVIQIHNTISIEDLSHHLGMKKNTLVSRIKKEALLDNFDVSTSLDHESATLIASVFGFEVKNLSKSDEDIIQSLEFGKLSAEKQIKPPVVTVMGHVNHGKTTLLDAIRKSRVASQEAGGITQHIGAYSVPAGKSFVTFVDTPGHSAFTAMRARGAKVTDIVVIVVAADDGVQPQTIEAINHAKNAKVPIIVAVNKVDLPDVNPDNIKNQLSEQELVPEEWGGDTIFCSISALKGEGIKELLEHIQLLAEVHELKANPERSAKGFLIESRMEKGRGWVMTLLVQDGTLESGQVLIAGDTIGRVRQMTNDVGKVIKKAGPGTPVEISGFTQFAQVGDIFYVVKDEKTARRYLDEKEKYKEKVEDKKLSIEELLEKTHLSTRKQLNVVLKTDVIGSQEAIKYSIEKLNTDEVETKILHINLGPVNESDVLLASASSAILLCFNVGVDSKAQKLIREKSILSKSYKVIYDLLEDVEKMMANLLDPEVKETPGGRAEVLQIFNISDIGMVAGCKVVEGKIQNKNLARVHREEQVIHEGSVSGLKRFKQEAKEVPVGQECGISLNNYKDIQVGDVIETFTQVKIKKDKL